MTGWTTHGDGIEVHTTRGGYIEFDNLGWNPGQDATHIAAIKELLDAGHGDRISHGEADSVLRWG